MSEFRVTALNNELNKAENKPLKSMGQVIPFVPKKQFTKIGVVTLLPCFLSEK